MLRDSISPILQIRELRLGVLRLSQCYRVSKWWDLDSINYIQIVAGSQGVLLYFETNFLTN